MADERTGGVLVEPYHSACYLEEFIAYSTAEDTPKNKDASKKTKGWRKILKLRRRRISVDDESKARAARITVVVIATKDELSSTYSGTGGLLSSTQAYLRMFGGRSSIMGATA